LEVGTGAFEVGSGKGQSGFGDDPESRRAFLFDLCYRGLDSRFDVSKKSLERAATVEAELLERSFQEDVPYEDIHKVSSIVLELLTSD
jgi:hypothetical protein